MWARVRRPENAHISSRSKVMRVQSAFTPGSLILKSASLSFKLRRPVFLSALTLPPQVHADKSVWFINVLGKQKQTNYWNQMTDRCGAGNAGWVVIFPLAAGVKQRVYISFFLLYIGNLSLRCGRAEQNHIFCTKEKGDVMLELLCKNVETEVTFNTQAYGSFRARPLWGLQ